MIDAALPLQTTQPNTLGMIGQVQKIGLNQGDLAEQQQQAQLGDQKIQANNYSLAQAGQEAQTQANTRAATAAATDPQTGQVDKGTLLSTLAKLDPSAAMQLRSSFATQDTAAQEAAQKLQQAKLQTATDTNNAMDKVLQGVVDQPSYTNALQHAQSLGINVSQFPQQYDPQIVARAHQQVLSTQQVLAQQNEQATQAETAKKDTATENLAQATQQNTAAYRQSELGLRRQQINQADAGTMSIAQVPDPDHPGQMKSVLLNNRSGAIRDTNPGLVRPSATQPVAGQPTTADRNRASLAKIALDNIDGIQKIVQSRPDLFGPGAGRVSNVDQLVGSNDPDLVAVTNFAHNFSMANAGVHGSRSVQNVRDAVQDLLGDLHNGPQGIMGGLNANRGNLNSIINGGSTPAANASGAPKVGTVKTFPNGKTGKWDGTGYVAQ